MYLLCESNSYFSEVQVKTTLFTLSPAIFGKAQLYLIYSRAAQKFICIAFRK